MVDVNRVFLPIHLIEADDFSVSGVENGFNRLWVKALDVFFFLLLKGKEAGLRLWSKLVCSKVGGDSFSAFSVRYVAFYRIFFNGVLLGVFGQILFQVGLCRDRFFTRFYGESAEGLVVDNVVFIQLLLPYQTPHQTVHVLLLTF